jgi:tRNA A37 N6-isopentenylltransferase MiaA
MSCWDEAYHYAQQLDAAGVAHVLRNDYYRLARIVTIAEELGEESYSNRLGYETPQMDLDLRGAFVYPADREALYRSLDRRCEKMLADGLLEEVAGLMHQHRRVGLPRKIVTIVGYRQTIDFLQQYPPGAPISVEQFQAFLKSFQNATRSYARRQMVYFRRSEKLNRVFRCVPAGSSSDSLRRIGEGIVELFHLSLDQYEKDQRWRTPLPVGDASALRQYVSRAEVFRDPANVSALLERLSIERSRLKKLN